MLRFYLLVISVLIIAPPTASIAQVPNPKAVLESDHQFDGGSGIDLRNLTPIQVANLKMLGQVWGFLKYHYRPVMRGERQWDYDLFRILPVILAAKDHTQANSEILRWINITGISMFCSMCIPPDETDLQMHPDLGWMADEATLGKPLSEKLRFIYRERIGQEKYFYVSLQPSTLIPSFDHELSYPNIKFPDAGFQILSLFRFWNVIEYWYPGREMMGENWPGVLAQFIPRIALAKTKDAYQLELAALIAKVHDSQAGLRNGVRVQPPRGECQVPVTVRFVQDHAVVTGYLNPKAAPKLLRIGDMIASIGGTPVTQLVSEWTPYYAASHEAVKLRDIARSLTRGVCGPIILGVERQGRSIELKASRSKAAAAGWTHDMPGETFRLLSPKVGYLKLSSAKSINAATYVESASGTLGMIIDIRNSPSDEMASTLGPLLVSRKTEFVRLTHADLARPGAFYWSKPRPLSPRKPHYPGKVVILVDEITQGHAEYAVMAFRAAGAIVVGSTTAGSGGTVSEIALPGGLSSTISGIGVFSPDKKPTQGIGIAPDVVVRPTIEGVRATRDEVLEQGIRQILGAQTSEAQIRKMARP